MSNVLILEEVPAADEYRALRVLAGLSPKTAEAAMRGLSGSLFGACARSDGTLIGMGRIIGDGGLNYEIVDMAVHPDHQRQGIGSLIMDALMSYLRKNAPPSAYVCLIADNDAPILYQKYGFEFTAPISVGMALRM